ncbi:hypothetical protein [Ornithinibacillus halotolerans]|uniref:Uncharacterized protein n=1 Tax=Ornithinibacillus halotolerans TaxID=1274357 RepID=A0A916W6B7_9BACI|nr:hypothetical protein [Ornithinibacillus halotolerans]GGA70673.1 hypothetical protein GCM10008025_13150 [Ornithinibacillus halotolerans]
MNKLILFTIILAIVIVCGVLAYKSLERMHDEKNPETDEEAHTFIIQDRA